MLLPETEKGTFLETCFNHSNYSGKSFFRAIRIHDFRISPLENALSKKTSYKNELNFSEDPICSILLFCYNLEAAIN